MRRITSIVACLGLAATAAMASTTTPAPSSIELAADAPAAILEASHQVDLHDVDFGDFWRAGLCLVEADPRIADWAAAAEGDAQAVLEGQAPPGALARVNAWSAKVDGAVQRAAEAVLDRGATPAVLGGDHSSPLGLLRAVAERFPGVGILHIDAHADLRDAYLGFHSSHASILHNALACPGIGRLVGVGYRDVGAAEVARIRAEPERIQAFFDADLGARAAEGIPWARTVDAIIAALPPQVYVSLDIDGLSPDLCPHTGTPVPGGLSFRELQVLLRVLADKRRVVGFDLCEVGAAPWDANVGARVLFKLAGCALRSAGGRP